MSQSRFSFDGLFFRSPAAIRWATLGVALCVVASPWTQAFAGDPTRQRVELAEGLVLEPWLVFDSSFDTSTLHSKMWDHELFEDGPPPHNPILVKIRARNGEELTEEETANVGPHLVITATEFGRTANFFIRHAEDAWDTGDAVGLVIDVTNYSERDMAVEARVDSKGAWGKAPVTSGRRGLMPGQRGDLVLYYDKRYGRTLDPPVTADAIRQVLIYVLEAQEGDRIMLHGVSRIVPGDPEPAATPPASTDEPS